MCVADTAKELLHIHLLEGEESGMPVFELVGDVDAYTAVERLKPILMDAFETQGARGAILVISGVNFIDSAGFQVLVSVYRRAVERGGTLVLVAPAESVVRALRICALDRLFPIVNSVTEAKGMFLTV